VRRAIGLLPTRDAAANPHGLSHNPSRPDRDVERPKIADGRRDRPIEFRRAAHVGPIARRTTAGRGDEFDGVLGQRRVEVNHRHRDAARR